MKINLDVNKILSENIKMRGERYGEPDEYLGEFSLICGIITKGEPTIFNAIESALKCCDRIYISYNGNDEFFEENVKQEFQNNDNIFIKRTTWENDFAKARNENLMEIKIKYPEAFVLWLDSDDTINYMDIKGILSLKSGKTNLPKYTREIILNCEPAEGEVILQTRIYQANGAFWEGKLHEQIKYVSEWGIAVRVPNITITHHGYDSTDLCDQKGKRNLEILNSISSKTPSVRFETGRVYLCEQNYIDALEHFLTAKSDGYNNPIIFYYIAECLSGLNKMGTIREFLKTVLDEIPDACFRLGELYAIDGDYKNAIKYLFKYLNEGERVTTYGSMFKIFKPIAIDLINNCIDKLN